MIKSRKKIIIGADDGSINNKKKLISQLEARGYKVIDGGSFQLVSSDDYPQYVCLVARAVSIGEADCGLLVCRSGGWMSIAANCFHGVRAALAESPEKARISRSHNAANVLVTGGDDMSEEDFEKTVEAWLSTPFLKEERHSQRLAEIESSAVDEIAAVRGVDPEVAAIIDREDRRQAEGIELIASENFASAAVRAATGSSLTNKYAEGYSGKRYYNGCEYIDEVETLAIDLVCELFGAEAANVQAHSGSQANMAVYFDSI